MVVQEAKNPGSANINTGFLSDCIVMESGVPGKKVVYNNLLKFKAYKLPDDHS